MTRIQKKEDIMDLAVCFADRALLLAESVSPGEGLAAGLLAESAVSLLMALAESEAHSSGKNRFLETAKGALARSSAAIRLLRTRGAIGDVAFACLKADGEGLKARMAGITEGVQARD